jgi:hypothetical protein
MPGTTFGQKLGMVSVGQSSDGHPVLCLRAAKEPHPHCQILVTYTEADDVLYRVDVAMNQAVGWTMLVAVFFVQTEVAGVLARLDRKSEDGRASDLLLII